MKITVVIILQFLLISCVSTSGKVTHQSKTKLVSYFSHPEAGEIKEDSVEYLQASAICEARVYSDGVEIDGVKITSREELKNISEKHREPHIRKFSVENYNFSGAHAGTQGALAVTTGNVYNERISAKNKGFNPLLDHLNYLQGDLPDHIRSIHELNKNFGKCMKDDLGVKKIRVDTVDIETGKVKRTLDLTSNRERKTPPNQE